MLLLLLLTGTQNCMSSIRQHFKGALEKFYRILLNICINKTLVFKVDSNSKNEAHKRQCRMVSLHHFYDWNIKFQ